MEILLPCVYSFIACVGYCFVANVRLRKKMLFFASLGGAIGWGVYLSFGYMENGIVQSFLAIMIVTIYAEILSRIFKAPATVYLVVGIIPLVPGGGIYYTMEQAIRGNTIEFLNTGLRTFGIAGAIALGILFASSGVRMIVNIRNLSKSIKSPNKSVSKKT
ncbi:MAG: hypothetical protein K0R15_2032 [Clostridiales bacterium]|jgi:uncharacterized membrane protein YjjB (DUF3815 family)|nr:hypothetical protein [Clostridiales bacterium]